MNRFLFGLAILVVLAGFSALAESRDLIKEFKGSESTTTAEFRVKAPWIVDWMTTGDYPGTMAMEVSLVSSPGGEYIGKIVTTKYVTNGVRLFNESGRYRLKVNSNLVTWRLRVEQLSRQEAEEYTPREPELN